MIKHLNIIPKEVVLQQMRDMKLSQEVIDAVEECPYGEPLHHHHDGCPACTPLVMYILTEYRNLTVGK